MWIRAPGDCHHASIWYSWNLFSDDRQYPNLEQCIGTILDTTTWSDLGNFFYNTQHANQAKPHTITSHHRVVVQLRWLRAAGLAAHLTSYDELYVFSSYMVWETPGASAARRWTDCAPYITWRSIYIPLIWSGRTLVVPELRRLHAAALAARNWAGCTHMVDHPCHDYGLITRCEVCNALRIWGYALCNSRNA